MVLSRGNGKPFVFIHGLAANARQTYDIWLEEPTYTVYCPECPGHGTTPFDHEASFDAYADHIIRFMDDHAINDAVLGGISMGAGISLNIALRYPERTKALVLIRPAWSDRPDPDNLMILKTAAPFVRDGNRHGFDQISFVKSLQSDLPLAYASLMGIFQEQQEHLPDVLEGMVGDVPFSSIDRLQKVTKRTLVIGNDKDPLHPMFMAEETAGSLPDSAFSVVTSRYIDAKMHQRELNERIINFLSSI